jgi:cold shock CspA family protein
MSTDTIYRGKVSFVNQEKQFGTIDYLHGTKEKSVNFKTTESDSGKKPHQFRVGDVVNFQLRLSDRGDKMTACKIKFQHNDAINLFIQRANFENRFTGYFKKVDGQLFIKEVDSYIFFPLQLSPWEQPPVETAENQLISFSLLNLDRPNAIVATLFSHVYIPQYKSAEVFFENKTPVKGVVNRVSPYAIYIDLFAGAMQGKLPLDQNSENPAEPGQEIEVIIEFLSPFKLVLKKA